MRKSHQTVIATDHKFDQKQYKRKHSSCAEVWEFELRRSGTYPCGCFLLAVVGLHNLVLELILTECEAVNESEKMDKDVYGNWSLIPSWALTHTVGRPNRARREGAGKRDGKATFHSTVPCVKEAWTTSSNRKYRV